MANAINNRKPKNRTVLAHKNVGKQRTDDWEEISGGDKVMIDLIGRSTAHLRSRFAGGHHVQILRHENDKYRPHPVKAETLGRLIANDVFDASWQSVGLFRNSLILAGHAESAFK